MGLSGNGSKRECGNGSKREWVGSRQANRRAYVLCHRPHHMHELPTAYPLPSASAAASAMPMAESSSRIFVDAQLPLADVAVMALSHFDVKVRRHASLWSARRIQPTGACRARAMQLCARAWLAGHSDRDRRAADQGAAEPGGDGPAVCRRDAHKHGRCARLVDPRHQGSPTAPPFQRALGRASTSGSRTLHPCACLLACLRCLPTCLYVLPAFLPACRHPGMLPACLRHSVRADRCE